ncbi:MAG TPA: hypothetical protein PKW59_11555 [Thermotogota bacterium]|nr:hypothetical protein [Thermotogota bacterium]
MKNKKFGALCSLFLLLSTIFAVNYMLLPFDGYYWDTALSKLKPVFTPEEGIVTNVIDAKTLEIDLINPFQKKIKVSLIGVNLSLFEEEEKADSLLFTKQNLEGKKVSLSYDWKGKDEEGNILAYIWLPVPKPGKLFYVLWNSVLIMNGFATISEEPFRVDYLGIFQDLYMMALENKYGLFKKWNTQKPTGWEEIPMQMQTTLRTLFFLDLEKSFNTREAMKESGWIKIQTITGVLVDDFDRTIIGDAQTASDEYYQGYYTGKAVSRYKYYKDYKITIDEVPWKIDWKIFPYDRYIRDSSTNVFKLEISDDANWSDVIVLTPSVLPKTFGGPKGETLIDATELAGTSEEIWRKGTFNLRISGPNPYLIKIFVKKQDF